MKVCENFGFHVPHCEQAQKLSSLHALCALGRSLITIAYKCAV